MAYDDLIEAAGKKYNVDPALIRSVMQTESSGNPAAVSNQGAQGLMQLMPATAKALSVTNPNDPAQNINAGAQLLAQNLDRYGNPQDALKAYHGGTDASNWGPKTNAYPNKVMSKMAKNLPGIPDTNDNVPDYFGQQYGNLAKEPNKSGAAGAASNTASTTNTADVPDYFGQQYATLASGANRSQPSSGNNPPAAAQAGQMSPEDYAKLVTPTNPILMGLGDVVKGISQTGTHIGSYLTNKFAPGSQTAQEWKQGAQQLDAAIAAQEAQYQKNRAQAAGVPISSLVTGQMPEQGIDWKRGIASALPYMVAPAAGGESFLGKIGANALQGAGYSLSQPVTNQDKSYLQQKINQAQTGALGGAAGSAIGSTVGGIIAPKLSQAAQSLRDAGINLTPGQMFGGMAKSIEDKLTSAPILGDLIRNAQRGSVEDFNKAVYQRALDHIEEKVTAPVGREAIDQISDKLKNAYNKLLPKVQFSADKQFQSDLGDITQAAQGLAEPQANQFTKILQNDLLRHMQPDGTMSGEALKKVESAIGQKAKNYSSSSVGSEREFGETLNQLLTSVRNNLERVNPDYADQLSKINQGYANYARIRQAASMTGAENGIFTPAQLQNVVRNTDKSVGKGNFAKGNALMQDLSEAGKSVIGNQYPDSGTAGRYLANTLIGGALTGGAATGYLNPGLLAAGGVASLPYTNVGRAAFNALMARPQGVMPIGNAARRYLPSVITPVVPTLFDSRNQ